MRQGGANGRVRVLVHSDSRVFSGAEWFLCESVRGMAESDRLALTCMAPEENQELSRRLEAIVGPDSVRPVRSQPTRLGAVHLYDPRRLAFLRRSSRARSGTWRSSTWAAPSTGRRRWPCETPR